MSHCVDKTIQCALTKNTSSLLVTLWLQVIAKRLREAKREKLIAIRLSAVNYLCFQCTCTYDIWKRKILDLSYIKLELALRRSYYLNMAMEITWSMDFAIAEVWMSIFFYVIQTAIRCYQQHIHQIWSSEVKFEIEFILFKSIHMGY